MHPGPQRQTARQPLDEEFQKKGFLGCEVWVSGVQGVRVLELQDRFRIREFGVVP